MDNNELGNTAVCMEGYAWKRKEVTRHADRDRGRSANGIGRAQGVAVVLASRRAGRVDDDFACFDCS